MGIREYIVQIIKRAVGGTTDYWAGLIADALIAHGFIDADTNVPTNADRIRAMSDEEMAQFFDNTICRGMSSSENLLAWLKQPAEEVDDG